MRSFPLIVAILFFSATAFAGEIREFDIKTIERLGNELTRVSQQSDRGAPNPVRKRAKETAIAALKGKLFNIQYDYVVLNDPDGKRLLVYALGSTTNSGGVVLAGHFRVTVSADGTKAERVDALSKSLARSGPITTGSPKGNDTAALFLIQLVSNKPVETLIHTSNLVKKPIYVRTPDGKTWVVEEGKMRVVASKASN